MHRKTRMGVTQQMPFQKTKKKKKDKKEKRKKKKEKL